MTVGIIGLGLIGGSLAKAYKSAGHTVLAYDADKNILDFAVMSGFIDGQLTIDGLRKADLILIAVYPAAAIEFLEKHSGNIGSDTVVIDCCGTKKNVCAVGFAAAERNGFTFVGGHPMAGAAQSGFKHSRADLFRGASMLIVPPVYDDIAFLERIKTLLAPVEFGKLTVTTAEKHDEMIAFTSQMAHLVSNAFIKSPTVLTHEGFSAGSYRDLTRVAWLNEQMWSELFLENRDCLLNELDIFIASLNEYREALSANDSVGLKQLLRDGKLIKEKVDRKQETL